MEALRDGADVIVMLHPDGQYDPAILSDMVEVISERARRCRPRITLSQPRRCARRRHALVEAARQQSLATGVRERALGLGLSEYHTGYRAYSRKFLTTVPFLRNSNDFVFDTQILTQAAAFNFTVAEVPVTTQYFDDASSVNFRVSMVYGLKTVWTVSRYHPAPYRAALAPLLALSGIRTA